MLFLNAFFYQAPSPLGVVTVRIPIIFRCRNSQDLRFLRSRICQNFLNLMLFNEREVIHTVVSSVAKVYPLFRLASRTFPNSFLKRMPTPNPSARAPHLAVPRGPIDVLWAAGRPVRRGGRCRRPLPCGRWRAPPTTCSPAASSADGTSSMPGARRRTHPLPDRPRRLESTQYP